MLTRHTVFSQVVLLLLATAAALLPRGATAAPTRKNYRSEIDAGTLQTKIIVDDHCPPTFVIQYEPSGNTVMATITYTAVCPLLLSQGDTTISLYQPAASQDSAQLAFKKVADLSSTRTASDVSLHRRKTVFTASLGPISTFANKHSLLVVIHYTQSVVIRGARRIIRRTAYSTLLLSDETESQMGKSDSGRSKP